MVRFVCHILSWASCPLSIRPKASRAMGKSIFFHLQVEDLLKALSKGCSPALRGTGTWTLGHWLLGPRPHCSPGATGRRDR